MSFTWIPIYSEIAHKVLEFENRQDELLSLLSQMRSDGLKVILLNDRDAGGNAIPLTEIDPFTFFASFNRTNSLNKRQEILEKLKLAWNLASPVPDDFDGIPIANPQNSWAFGYLANRRAHDIAILWRAARKGVEGSWRTFDRSLFDEALGVTHMGLAKLTISLFWLNPQGFLPCDKHTAGYFKQRGVVWESKTAAGYFSWIEKAAASAGENFPRVSMDAYESGMVEENESGELELPPNELASPFDEFFASLDEANWGFEFMRQTLAALGVGESAAAGDRRICLSLTNRGGGTRLRLNFGNWALVTFLSRSVGADHVEYVCREDLVPSSSLRKPDDRLFSSRIDGRGFFLALGAVERLRDFEGQEFRAFKESLSDVARRFADWDAGPWPSAHKPQLLQMVYDAELRNSVLRTGLDTTRETAYLLTWNPDRWPWSNLPESAKNLRDGVQLESGDKGARWSVGNHGIKPDDRVFIVRVGAEPKGIVGSGTATSAVYDAPHYSGEEGKLGHYVDIEWDALIDPSVAAPLSIATLRQNVSSDYKWTPQLSGILIPDGVQQKLEAEWARHQNHIGDRADAGFTDAARAGTPEAKIEIFTKADALKGLFMTPDFLDTILTRLRRKKALILQGPPGVGKTFIARRLAFALMGERDERRVAMVQFHPSYGYEDLVQGYRPSGNGGLEKRNGVLHQFARLAQNAPDRDWFFIIDEINRGNLAKIFGELLMLIEADKRGPAHAVPLTYSDGADETFHLPANLYFIGTMNTADRSLAMVDYALRRRFAFVTLHPALDSPAFATWLKGRGATDELIARIRARVGTLNTAIDKARDLGPRFRIGHSFFCPPDGFRPDAAWYREVIAGEIEPLLEEYFDSRESVEKLVAELLAE